jgi:hypothetical protein
MVWIQTLAIAAPSIIPLFILYREWTALEYGPWLAIVVFVFSLLPLLVQIAIRGYELAPSPDSSTSRPIHPFGIVLPLSVMVVFPLLPLGEFIAKHVPCLCQTVAGEHILTSRKVGDRQISFVVHFYGWGNSKSFRFTSAVIVYTGESQRGEDLYVRLGDRRGHFTNSYTSYFVVTEDEIAEFVRSHGEFAEQEVERITDELWALLDRYSQNRDMPPVINDFHQGSEPRIVSYVPPRTSYLVAALLSLLATTTLSWFLARRYCRKVAEAPAGQSN